MLKRDQLLDILKTRFDYYAATAVYHDLLSSQGLQEVKVLDEAAVQGVCAFLAEKVPGTQALVERLGAFGATVAADAPAEAPAKAEPAAEAPAVEAPAEEAPADDAADDGKKKKKK